MTGKAKWRVESKNFQVVTRFDSLTLEEDREFFVSKETFVDLAEYGTVDWDLFRSSLVVAPDLDVDGIATPSESNLQLWYQVVASREAKDSKRFDNHHGSAEQMFSLWLYYWMIHHENLTSQELDSRIYIDGMTYLAERVFELPYNELNLHFTEDEIYGDGFGDKGVLDICRDGVDLRVAAHESTIRAMHEGLGMWNLHHQLKVMNPGDVSVLVSPPDPNDPNMGGYNLIYLYEKTGPDSVRMGIITDTTRTIEEWRVLARDLSNNSVLFQDYDHLRFVAHPFIAKSGLSSLKSILLDVEQVAIPDWALDGLRQVIPSIREALYASDVRRAEELFNGFKIATTSRLLNPTMRVDVKRLLDDIDYFNAISLWYMQSGGAQYLNKRTGCSLDRISLGRTNLFAEQSNQLTRLDFSDVGDRGSASSEVSTTTKGDIVVTLDDGTTYVLTIREGWRCNMEGCDRVSSSETRVRIGECHICEFCDPNVHKGD